MLIPLGSTLHHKGVFEQEKEREVAKLAWIQMVIAISKWVENWEPCKYKRCSCCALYFSKQNVNNHSNVRKNTQY